MGNFIELVFHRFFLGMIATAYFWLLTLAGGVVFGIAPASATIMSLFAEHGYSYRAYGFKEAWTLYKSNFIKSNLSFYTFMGLDLILIYGLYLMIQLPQPEPDIHELSHLATIPLDHFFHLGETFPFQKERLCSQQLGYFLWYCQ